MLIPSMPKYDITEDGIVSHVDTGVVCSVRRNNAGLKSAVMHVRGHKTTRPICRLLLKTFKPLEYDRTDDWLSVRYLDGDKDNLKLENLEWDNTIYEPSIIPGVTHPENVWVPVYGFDNFEVRLLNGVEFRNPRTGNSYIPKAKENGYFSIIDPNGKFWEVHRLVALTFLEHPLDTYHLVVNHKDNDKTNNHPSNLEWLTQSENLRYRYDYENSVVSGRRVLLQSLEDYTVSGYPSIHAAARFLDTNPGHIYSMCTHRQRRGLGYKGFLIKFEDDPTPWSVIRQDVSKNQEPYRIAVKDMLTGEVTIYNSLMQTVRGEFINPKTIYRLLWNEIPVPWNGKCFQSYKEEMVWPEYPREIIEASLKKENNRSSGENSGNKKPPLRATYEDGSVKYYANVRAWCDEHRHLRAKEFPVQRAIRRDGEWRGVKLEFVEWKDYVSQAKM